MKDFKKKIYASEPLECLLSAIPANNSAVTLHGLAGSLWSFVVTAVFLSTNDQLFVVLDDEDRAEKLRDDCVALIGESNVKLCTAETRRSSQSLDMNSPLSQIEMMKALGAKKPGVYITHISALAYGVPERSEFAKAIIELSANTEYDFQKLIQQLQNHGFERKPIVETYGDFAVRGGILDIFPFIGEHPVRMEFWGDTIESIREFDVLSQRSIRELQSVSIVPDIVKKNSSDAASDESTKNTSLLSYLSETAVLFLEDTALLEKVFVDLQTELIHTDFSYEQIQEQLKQYPRFIHSLLTAAEAIDFKAQTQPSVNGSIKILLETITRLALKGYDIVITSDKQDELKRIQELIEEERNSVQTAPSSPAHAALLELPEEKMEDNILVFYTIESFHSGFVYDSAKVAVFTEHEIFGRIKARGEKKRKRFKGISQKELTTLRRGDYVTHVDYGIGRFLRLEKIVVGGIEQEVARLEYAEKGNLFVNLNYITRIQKYSSSEGHEPKLSKLGSPEWDRLKARTKKRIKDIARDLITLYAKRKHEPAYTFSPDTHWQKEMEASFMYEDTPDQLRATTEVKTDMEAAAPMDRLVCGDVGFGKTEIAVRAAFKAVMDNKQAAVLVPTTILAQQHFNTFSDRLGRYPVRIALLSRFKSSKEIKETLHKLAEGNVDIIIGTHRLLSKDVTFKDLGLLIIDEEQRFGVSAKEKLRSMRVSVDTLTLTATPIPRTLHFSLLGARDLSIINTPPRNRLPIHTEIATFDKKIIREAVLRELRRGGQIFVVNDRVHNLDQFTSTLQTYIPEAKFRTAHGQMKGHELETIMIDFLQKKFDVLVTTKIIESGVDIPSVNTIIINRADKFGLAELYQLRGRVGRSNVQAFAYLLVPPVSSLPAQTLRRLQAIEEFTELGSGFNLAMRDLEIRGAGNMLGAEQSGFIMEMGFEMYTKILEEAVAELKEQEFSNLFSKEILETRRSIETQIELDIEALIPDLYIESDTERLDVYRRLYKTKTEHEVNELRAELSDRFGSPMEEVENLFKAGLLRVAAQQTTFIRKVEIHKRTLRLYLPAEDDMQFYEGGEFQKIMSAVSSLKNIQLHFKQEGKNLLLHTSLRSDDGIERVDEAIKIINNIH
ncbi:MAG: transcription-repair coupling factor [Bacteroidetes bacterium]|nr:transcription-repair coupling factor [Bacteroidota bacterium]